MPYENETDFAKIPYPNAGEESSAAEEAYRSGIPDIYFELLVKALSNANADGTLQESFQVGTTRWPIGTRSILSSISACTWR